MDAEKLVAQIANVIGLPSLRLDPRGLARIRIEGSPDLCLELDKAADCLHLYSTIAPASGTLEPALAEALLCGNAFGKATGGATLGLDRLGSEIILCHRLESSDLHPSTLLDIFERFVAAADHWIRELAARRDLPGEATGTQPIQPATRPDPLRLMSLRA